MKERYYHKHIGDLKKRLKEHISTEQLRELHKIRPWKHFLLVGRQVLLFLGCAWALYAIENPWIWIPLAAIQGFQILGFIILLHEQVHSLIFTRKHPRWMRALGLSYAFPSAISATQPSSVTLAAEYQMVSHSSIKRRLFSRRASRRTPLALTWKK